MNLNNENIHELLNKFFDQQTTEIIEKDMEYADQLFKNHKCPALSTEITEQIKAKVNSRLSKKKKFTIARNITAAAACLLLITTGAFIFSSFSATENNNTQQLAVKSGFWDSTENYDHETTAADFYSRIEDIETNLMNIRLDESDNYQENLQIINLEMEVIEETDFWKG